MPTDALLQFGKARVGHGVQGPQARQRPLLVGSGKPAISGAIGRQDGREFCGFPPLPLLGA